MDPSEYIMHLYFFLLFVSNYMTSIQILLFNFKINKHQQPFLCKSFHFFMEIFVPFIICWTWVLLLLTLDFVTNILGVTTLALGSWLGYEETRKTNQEWGDWSHALLCVAKWKGISPNTLPPGFSFRNRKSWDISNNVGQFLVFRKSIGSRLKAFCNMEYLVILSLKIFLKKKNSLVSRRGQIFLTNPISTCTSTWV